MRIGIDLGGTKIEAVLMDAAGEICAKQRIASPSSHYELIIETIARLVSRLEAECQSPCRVGLGTPGSPSPQTGLMRNSNSTVINGRNLKGDLEYRLNREIRLANDANCFALSEAVDGAGEGHELVFGVILGTGVGGGLVVKENPLLGLNHLGGEWGHNALPGATEGRVCYCGENDCIETYLCGGGLLRTARQSLPELESTETLALLLEQGDPAAQAMLDRYTRQLARSLAGVINIVDPDVIVLGGGVSNIVGLYPAVNTLLADCVFGRECRTPVVPARHGDSSGVRGAAWLWPAQAQ